MVSKCNSCGQEVGWRKFTKQDGGVLNIMTNPNGEDHKEKIGDKWQCKKPKGQTPQAGQATLQPDIATALQQINAKIDTILNHLAEKL